ncbi:MAG: hypothetical protein R3F29_10895 [Planctomycetota bacterium]
MALRSLLAAAALVTFVSPVSAQDADLRDRINQALDMARPALLEHLEATTRGTRPGELALLLLAALHDGISVDDPVMKKAIGKLQKARPEQTYDIALRLLVLEACPTFPDRDDLAKKDTKALLRHRSKDGAFQYDDSPSAWDLSNTQYGALGLRAAAALGATVSREVWSKLADEVGDQQSKDGSFGYTRQSSGARGYASMTAAGIAVLAICRQGMEQKATRRTLEKIDERIDKAWGWFGANSHVIGSTTETWSYYFHYGLERAAILTDVVEVGNGVEWYATGARMLVDEQLPGGGWQSTSDGFPGTHLSKKRGDSVPTAFAVLFLRRKFQKNVGPITEHVVMLINLGPLSKDADVDACAQWLVGRGKEAMPDLIGALRSDVEPQRRAAGKALKLICGDDYGYDAGKDRDGNRDAVKQAELWYLKNR